MGQLGKGETMTMAPIVVKGKVIVGSSGGEMGVRGWIAAIDVATGKEVWRAYNIGPDADIKVGARFKNFYSHGHVAEPGRDELAGDDVEAGRRDGVGMDLVRSAAQPHLSRHVESRTVERRAASRRQQVERGDHRARREHRRDGVGVPADAARRVGLRRGEREHPRRPADRRHARERRSSTSIATASPTRWIARPARCCSRSRTCR